MSCPAPGYGEGLKASDEHVDACALAGIHGGEFEGRAASGEAVNLAGIWGYTALRGRACCGRGVTGYRARDGSISEASAARIREAG